MFDNRYLANLIIPLLIETLFSVTIGMMDTIMVARVGEHAVSGVSLVDSVSNLFVFLFSAFATGGAVVASQYLGKKDQKNSCFAAKQLIYLSFFFSTAVSIIMLIFRTFTLDVIYGDIEASVMGSALDYFTPILISFPFLALLNSANAIFRAMGKSRITMIVSIIMNAINISGNAFFIYVCGMGTFGAGLASLISRIVACVFMLYKVTRKEETIHAENLLRFDISLGMIGRVLKIALPSGIENCIFHIGKILISSTIASFGTASIAANAVFSALSTFANIPGTAVGMAAVPDRDILAAGIHRSQLPPGSRRREVHDDHIDNIDVGIPGHALKDPRRQPRPGIPWYMLGHVHRLVLPRHLLHHPLHAREMEIEDSRMIKA